MAAEFISVIRSLQLLFISFHPHTYKCILYIIMAASYIRSKYVRSINPNPKRNKKDITLSRFAGLYMTNTSQHFSTISVCCSLSIIYYFMAKLTYIHIVVWSTTKFYAPCRTHTQFGQRELFITNQMTKLVFAPRDIQLYCRKWKSIKTYAHLKYLNILVTIL